MTFHPYSPSLQEAESLLQEIALINIRSKLDVFQISFLVFLRIVVQFFFYMYIYIQYEKFLQN